MAVHRTLLEPELIQRAEVPEPVAVRMEEEKRRSEEKAERRKESPFLLRPRASASMAGESRTVYGENPYTKKDAESTERTGAAQWAEHRKILKSCSRQEIRREPEQYRAWKAPQARRYSRIRCRTMPEPEKLQSGMRIILSER